MQTTDLELTQGTAEWLALRKSKITGTDAAVIMGVSPWKTLLELYHEKTSNQPPQKKNYAMERGIKLEPMARDLYSIMSGYDVHPKVIINDWAMASLDGIDCLGIHAVEIKCPGYKDHSLALEGKIPEYYYPQLQHIIWVCGLDKIDYFSFDGTYGVIVEVLRNPEYIYKMAEAEEKFYWNLLNKIPPEPSEEDYVTREDEEWKVCALKWTHLNDTLKQLQKEADEIKNGLIHMAGSSNAKGAGISLCKVIRRGNIEYDLIPELFGVDLEPYRKKSFTSWRINQC